MYTCVSYFVFHTWAWYTVACFKNSTTSSHPLALAWRWQHKNLLANATKCLASSFIWLYLCIINEGVNCLVIILYSIEIPINSPLQWVSVHHNCTWSYQPRLTAKSPILLNRHSPQDCKTHSRSSKWTIINSIINTADNQFWYAFNTRSIIFIF